MILDLNLNREEVDFWPALAEVVNQNGYDQDKIKKAYDMAKDFYGGEKRNSGEAYLSHPVWVAKLVAQLNIGEEAVIAALLHELIAYGIELEKIAEEFGDEVALLVDGLTEVRKKTGGVEVQQDNVEIFRRFLFSSVDDVRVLIIRLSDKLHDGLTIDGLSKEEQKDYAQRVLGIYAPIAEYVGLYFFKRKLDDIAFKAINPEMAAKMEILIENRKNDEIKALALVKSEIEEMLKINNLNKYEIQGRIKSLYSTYLKIKSKGEDRVKDRVGIRILTESIADCYNILGLLHAKYKYLPEEFNDYISDPKPNGYRSLQTTLNWKGKITLEVQIRTFKMHEFNEFGPASHIAYKMRDEKQSGKGYEWVKELINWQRDNKNVNTYKINVLSNFVYVATPKGDIIQLPKGATVLDFAYRIHTEIGDHCMGAKINNKMGKISTVLTSGDVVEIITNNKINVNKNWLELVTTRWAKEHIRKMTA